MVINARRPAAGQSWCIPTTDDKNQQQTRSPAVARTVDRCQWPSRSSKVSDFHFIWQGVWHFLLVINSNLGHISHRFWDMASFPTKTHIFPSPPPFFSEFALDRWNFACLGLRRRANYSWKVFPYDLPLSHNTSVTDDDSGRKNRWTYNNRTNSSTIS